MGRVDRLHVKVPEITLSFWVIKVLTTAMGEATSDYFVHGVGLQDTIALAGIGATTGVVLLLSLALQLAEQRYVAWIYWLAVVMVAVFGTMAADAVHVELGVPYALSSSLFAAALAAVFWLWFRSERTLSIHGIVNRRRELFYWAVVIATFALGTAVGDMTATTLHLGYLASGVLFCALIAVPAIGYRWLGWDEVFAFWFAYVLTRPLGASFADWLGFPRDAGGLGVGHGVVAVILGVVIAGMIGYLTMTRAPGPLRARGTELEGEA